VKIWAASADAETSNTIALRESLLGACAVELLVGRNAVHDLDDAPLALRLAGRTSLQHPHVLERLAVAGSPPLLALVMLVLAAGPQRAGADLRISGLGQPASPRDCPAA